QISEYNIKDYINDHEASLKGLIDHFDQFVECLQDHTISTNYLSTVQQFGKITGIPYVKCNIEENTRNIILRIIYKCYRSGTYQTIAGQSYSDKKPRFSQKESKKCTDSDIGTLRLSKEISNWIAKHIWNGLNIKGIVQLFKKHTHDLEDIWKKRNQNNAIQIRDNFVTYDDIYNIWKEIILESQMKYKSEEQSIELWRIELEQKNDLTCAIPLSKENNEYSIDKLFGFIVSTGKKIICKAPIILLDATYGTN
ncbi:10260_t:CDS:2, partial [Racocetra persica]